MGGTDDNMVFVVSARGNHVTVMFDFAAVFSMWVIYIIATQCTTSCNSFQGP